MIFLLEKRTPSFATASPCFASIQGVDEPHSTSRRGRLVKLVPREAKQRAALPVGKFGECPRDIAAADVCGGTLARLRSVKDEASKRRKQAGFKILFLGVKPASSAWRLANVSKTDFLLRCRWLKRLVNADKTQISRLSAPPAVAGPAL